MYSIYNKNYICKKKLLFINKSSQLCLLLLFFLLLFLFSICHPPTFGRKFDQYSPKSAPKYDNMSNKAKYQWKNKIKHKKYKYIYFNMLISKHAPIFKVYIHIAMVSSVFFCKHWPKLKYLPKKLLNRHLNAWFPHWFVVLQQSGCFFLKWSYRNQGCPLVGQCMPY